MLFRNLKTDFHNPIRSTSDAQTLAWLIAGLVFVSGLTIDALVNDAFATSLARLVASLITISGISFLIAYPIALLLGTTFLTLYRTQQKLAGLEVSDPLTGLRTRRRLMADLAEIGRAGGTLLLLDIDRFRFINDGFGPEQGDKVLVRLARLLAEELGELGTLYRFGSDEFLLLAPGHNIGEVRSRASAATLRLELAEFGTPNEHIGLSLSGGIVPIPEIIDQRLLFAKANSALEQARNAGRGRISLLDCPGGGDEGLVIGEEIAWNSDDLPRTPELGRRRGHLIRLSSAPNA